MAKTIEEILGRNISTTKELREAIKQLQDQLVTASSDTQEWTDTASKLTAAQTKLKEVMDAGKQSVDAAEDSIVGMERQYKELYNTYKLLSDEQRKSPFGTQMAQELETLSTKLNETKKGVGNFKDNIGRYTDSAIEAFSAMGMSIGGLTTPLGLANGGFKVLNATIAANPIFWLIAAIKLLISVFNKVKEAIAGNEESQMRLNQAMAAFQPVIDAVSNSFDKMGQVVVSVIGIVSKAYTKIRELWAGFTDFIGITEGAKEQIQETNRLYADLAKRTNELTLAKREQAKLNASQEAEVKTLLDQAAGTADATKKMNLLNEAKRIQQEITDRNIKIAEEEYNLLLEKSKLTANDAEMNDKLAEAEAAVARARAEGAAKTKEMTSQITSLIKQTNNYNDALKKEKEEVENILKTIEENSKSELQKLEDKYKKEYNLLKKHGKDTTELTRQYLKEKAKIEKEADEKQKADIKNTLTGQIDSSNTAKETSILKQKLAIIDNEKLAEEEKVEMLKNLDDELRQYKMDNILWEIENIELTNEEKLAKWQEYYAAVKEIEDEAAAERQEKAQKAAELDELQFERNINLIDSNIGILDSIGALSDAISQNIERTMDDADETEDSVKKKKKALKTLQDIQMAVGIAAIAADTAAGIMGIWRGYAMEKVANAETAAATGPAAAVTLAALNAKSLASAIIQTAGMGIMGAAQMASLISGTISNKKEIDGDTGGGGAAGTIATPAVIDTTPYSYTRQVQTAEEEAALNRPIWVSVTDIESGMNHVKVVDQESTF